MRKLIMLCLWCGGVLFAQGRNAQVRNMNTLINFMDEASRINMELYWDVKQFAEGYIHSSQKNNHNYWYTHAHPGMYVSSYDRAERFSEITVDNRGMMSDFDYILFPCLQARELADSIVSTGFLHNKGNLETAFTNFRLQTDSMFQLHRTLYNYVVNKNYQNDPGYNEAIIIIKRAEVILDNYHIYAHNLYDALLSYYNANTPPLKTQPLIIKAVNEQWKTMDILIQWEAHLHNGDTSFNHTYDAQIHALNDEGLAKDSIYLYTTYGYGVSSNGAMPHSRYRAFFDMLKPTLYWFVKDKYQVPSFMKKEDIWYNEFVDRTHTGVEFYNYFLECADGKQLSNNMHYSMKMAAQLGVDTNQNVLLNFPRWGYLFHFINPVTPVITPTEPKDTITADQQLINAATPHHLMFAVDVSSSMHQDGKMDVLKTGVKYLVSLQRPVDHISLITFSTHAHVLLRNIPCNKKEDIYTSIDDLQAAGATNASEAVRVAVHIGDSTSNSTGKTKLIMVTDGRFSLDNDAIDLIHHFKKHGLELVIILLDIKDKNNTANYFTQLAKKGNGRFYLADKEHINDILIKEAGN